MQHELKQRIHTLVDSIEDEAKLQLLMEDVEAYITEAGKSEDDLTDDEIREIDKSIDEIDRGDSVSWEDLKKTMKEWRERLINQHLPPSLRGFLPEAIPSLCWQ